jgi:zinc transport system substrate-binding protein
MKPTRREFLGAGAAAAGLGMAGCLDAVGLGDEDIDADGYAAFFPLYDFAQQVSGGAMTFTEPVGTGRMGHGWSPDATLVPDVASTRVFVYLDTPEFSWAQDIATTLERDHPEVALVDLFDVSGARTNGEDDGHHHDEEHNHDGDHKEDGHHHDEESSQNHDEEHNHEGDHSGDEGGHDGHDHAGRDPHIWLDPVRAEAMVKALGTELGAVQPDSQSTFTENAAAYAEEIRAVDEQLTAVVEDATLDTAVLVGHNSFQYLANRYGLTLETPVGISPNASASQRDIGGLLDVIDQQGIETVLYDPFEAGGAGEYPQLVQTVFENSAVTDAKPFSPISGTTEQWEANDWGWVEQMTELNIPSLEAALNAQ